MEEPVGVTLCEIAGNAVDRIGHEGLVEQRATDSLTGERVDREIRHCKEDLSALAVDQIDMGRNAMIAANQHPLNG